MKLRFLLFIILFIHLKSDGQFYSSTGSLPSGIKWNQINSDTVRVVYPEGLGLRAQRIANVVHFISAKNMNSLGDISDKIDIFLINKSSVSNGFVTSAPYHSKFFTMPPQEPFGGTIDWLDLLSLHEYRHVMQMNNTKHGITKWLRKIFGETIWTGAMFLAIPNWFWEGDAVMQETILSSSGRGRLPLFRSRFFDIINQSNVYSYEKMRCGSYRDIVPNHYSLGYQMVEYGRKRYGKDIWKKCVKDASSFRGMFWPFSRALKRYAGISTKGLYEEMTVDSPTTKLIEDTVSYMFKSSINEDNPTFYSFPKFLNTDVLYAIKNSFDTEPYIVKINISDIPKEEKVLAVSFNFGHYDINDKYIVWDEINKHPRWDYVSYSNIYKKNITNGEITQLTKKTRYFSPSISPNGKYIAVVEAKENMTYNLILLNLESGDVIKEIDNKDNYFIRNIDWLSNSEIVVIAQKGNKNAIINFDLDKSHLEILIPFSTRTLYDISATKNKILFSTHFENLEHSICYYDIKSKRVFVNQKGNYQPRIMPSLADNGTLAFCDKIFNNTVLKVGSFEKDIKFKENNVFFEDSIEKSSNINYLSKGEEQTILDAIPNQKFEVDEYYPNKHLLNFHSWMPRLVNPNYSLVFQSNDKLDKMSFSVEPTYNSNDNSFTLNTGLTYAGWYPILYIGLSPRFNIHHTKTIDGKTLEYVSNLGQIKSSIRIPWSFARLNYQKAINTRLDFYGYKYISSTDESIKKNLNSRLDFELTYVNLIKSSYRSIYPKAGLDARLKLYDITISKGPKMLSGNFRLLLPGLLKTHSFRLRFGYFGNFLSDSNSEISLGSSEYYFARGSNNKIVERIVSGAKINYSFPIVYPDYALDKFAFIKRIRANLFFDIDRFDGILNEVSYQRSAGLEIIFDNVYFRSVQIPVGISIDFLFDTKKNEHPIKLRLIVDI